LVDGTVEVGQMPCSGVMVTDDNRLLVVTAPYDPSDPYSFFRPSLYAFDSWDDALAGRAKAIYPSGDFWSETLRSTVRNGIVYRAWHSTDTIWRSDLVTGNSLPSIVLQGYDGWILGLAATGNDQLVIPGDTWGTTVRIFNATNGALQGTITPQVAVTGAACVDRR
jgi:hypothetical protein